MNGSWVDLRTGDIYEWENGPVEVTVTENPVVHELLNASGKVIRQWTERPPIGFTT